MMETFILIVQMGSMLYLLVMVPQILQKMLLGVVHNRCYISGIYDAAVASSVLFLWLYGMPSL